MSALEFQQQLIGLRQQLYYFALSLTRDRDNALDLLQDSLARALTFRDKFRDNTNFKAWLFTIMKNTFINGHRRNKRTRALMTSVESDHDRLKQVQEQTSTDGLTRLGEISVSLERLDPLFRDPFLLHVDGFKYNEIAETLAIPIGTVKSRIFEARQRLMGMLSDNQPAG
ncbi:MAG: RNA polymerase sigma factor [Flavobacteriales bacterium]|nr:RNA polymerase sigma factor [Flavobacteriales bacterium]